MRNRFAAVLLAMALLSCLGEVAAFPLDGRSFEGEIVDEKGTERSKDVIQFREGKFYSVTCARFGFGEAPYWTRTEGDTIHFLAEVVHPENGSMHFKGAIRGAHAEWTAVWTKKRWYWSIRREIAFRGTQTK
jgi:hypothetical protein